MFTSLDSDTTPPGAPTGAAVDVDLDGSTTIGNGQGLCKACNHTKQGAGWSTRSTGVKINLTVPTGHSYSSVAPPPPRSRAWHTYSSIEHRLAKTAWCSA